MLLVIVGLKLQSSRTNFNKVGGNLSQCDNFCLINNKNNNKNKIIIKWLKLHRMGKRNI